MRFRRFLAVAVVAICICVPTIEAVDSWDHTLQDGNDTEANLVVTALCVGFALTAAMTMVMVRLRAIPTAAHLACQAPSVIRFRTARLAVPAPTGSPPLALRI
jgi:hypothetical protein